MYRYIWCIYGIFGREITIHTVIYGVYIRFWPTLHMGQHVTRTCVRTRHKQCMHTHTHTCMSKNLNAYIHTYICTHTHTYTHTHTTMYLNRSPTQQRRESQPLNDGTSGTSGIRRRHDARCVCERERESSDARYLCMYVCALAYWMGFV